MRKKVLIIIPVYNEEDNIGELLQEMKKEKIRDLGDILVINDGSTDKSREIVESHKIEIINKPFNMGYGSSLQLAYKYASRHGYDYVIQIDGDGQHDIINISNIYNKLVSEQGPDIVIGSRFLCDKTGMKISWPKNSAIKFFQRVIKIVSKKEITDPTSGLQGLNREAFEFYAGYGNFDYRYPDINMLMQMLMLGYTIEEIPARMHPRQGGKSMHAGLIKPLIYMIIMSLSTISVIIRERKSQWS